MPDEDDLGIPERLEKGSRPRMNRPLERGQASPAAQEAARGLASLFKNREAQYTPISKSLIAIGITPVIMDVMIGEETQQCLVIPALELVFKEWQHMTGSDFASQEMLREESNG